MDRRKISSKHLKAGTHHLRKHATLEPAWTFQYEKLEVKIFQVGRTLQRFICKVNQSPCQSEPQQMLNHVDIQKFQF